MELCSDAGCRLLTYLLCSFRNVAVNLELQLTYSSSLHQEFNRPSVHQDQQAGVQSSCQSAGVPLTQDALQATSTCIVQFTNPLWRRALVTGPLPLSSFGGNEWSITTSDDFE